MKQLDVLGFLITKERVRNYSGTSIHGSRIYVRIQLTMDVGR